MGYSPEHTAATRARILASAGRLFRRHGFRGVGIDEIMSGAGLTRGGFYAHFKSKEDLFVQVLAEEPEFALQLRRVREADVRTDARPPLDAVEYYLAPGHRERVGRGCSLVANAPDIARASKRARDRFTERFQDVAAEFEALLSERVAEAEPERALAALATCVGGVALARGLTDDALACELLDACRVQVANILDREEEHSARPSVA